MLCNVNVLYTFFKLLKNVFQNIYNKIVFEYTSIDI